MCRNIRTLYNFDPPATAEEVDAAAVQFVRKISGFSKLSQVNQEAFDRAVHDVAAISARLLHELQTAAPPKDREVEAARRRPVLRRVTATGRWPGAAGGALALGLGVGIRGALARFVGFIL